MFILALYIYVVYVLVYYVNDTGVIFCCGQSHSMVQKK